MTMRVTMRDPRRSEDGLSMLLTGQTYTVSDDYGKLLVSLGAVDTDLVIAAREVAMREQLLAKEAMSTRSLVSGAWNRPLAAGQSAIQTWGGALKVGDWTVTGGSPTITQEVRNGRQCLKIVAPNSTRIDIDLTPVGGDCAWFGRGSILVEGNYAAGVQYWKLIVTADSFTNNLQATQYGCLGAPLNDPREQGGIFALRWDGQVTSGATAQQFTGAGATWGTTLHATDGSITINKMRLSITPKDANGFTAYVYGVSLSPRRKTGRVFVTVDDGYKSLVRLGLPIFQARGIPITLGVIGKIMGDRDNVSNDYLTWRDCKSVIAAGGQCVAHGPIVDMTSNLISALPTNDERIADMLRAVQYINDNGCTTANFEQVYVWPQGVTQSVSNDLTLLDAALAAGFTVGRSSGVLTTTQYEFSMMSKYQRMSLPVLGHGYAGGSEATNITTIATAIGAAGTARTDCILMLHKFVKTGATPDAIGIAQNNLITLADAIAAEITAGRMVAGVLGDLAEPSIWSD